MAEDEKIERDKEIADNLSNNNKWKSHVRPINIGAKKNYDERSMNKARFKTGVRRLGIL